MPNRRRLLDVLLPAFRPARWSIFGVRFVPLVLFAVGVWAVVYGGFYHRIPVTETHEEQITIEEPVVGWRPPGMPPFSPAEGFGQSTDAFGQPTDPSAPPPAAFVPPVKFVQAVQTIKTTSEESELAVNRAVTVAGIVRGPEGEIARVSSAAEGPGFCPS